MKRIAVLTAVIAALVLLLPLKAGAGNDIDTDKLGAYVLVEAGTGTVLEEYNGDVELFCGSLSKLMTLLLVAEDIETGKYTLDRELPVSQTVEGIGGAVVWLRPGDTMTVDELLKSVIIGNANDAAAVLAEASERSVEQFVMRMNSEAFDIGLRNTAFMSPYGTYNEKEHTTARDMAVICSRLARYGFLRKYFCTWMDRVRGGLTEVVSENTLTRTYDGHIGFKACHSEMSGYCVAEGAENAGGTAYIAVVIGAENENVSLGTAKKLLRRGFSGYKVTAADFPDEMLMPVKVSRGEETAVELMLGRRREAAVERGGAELSSISVIPAYLTAPVKRGQKVGTAAFYQGKTLICETDIVVKNNVKKLTWKFIAAKMLFNMLG